MVYRPEDVVPEALVFVVMLVGCLWTSVTMHAVITRRFPRLLPALQNMPVIRHLLPKNGSDIQFLWLYAACVIGSIVFMGILAWLFAPFYGRVCVALLVSIFGVTGSIYLNDAFIFADTKVMRDLELSGEATQVRCIFLHGSVAAAIALSVMVLPFLCPI